MLEYKIQSIRLNEYMLIQEKQACLFVPGRRVRIWVKMA